MQKAKVGIVGCGNISQIYFQAGKTFEILDIVACADLDLARAKAKAEEHGTQAMTVEQLLGDPEIEIVINLTIPGAHFSVCRDALQAGKQCPHGEAAVPDARGGAGAASVGRGEGAARRLRPRTRSWGRGTRRAAS